MSKSIFLVIGLVMCFSAAYAKADDSAVQTELQSLKARVAALEATAKPRWLCTANCGLGYDFQQTNSQLYTVPVFAMGNTRDEAFGKLNAMCVDLGTRVSKQFWGPGNNITVRTPILYDTLGNYIGNGGLRPYLNERQSCFENL